MAEIVTMPRLSDTMTEGVVAQWHKKVGDKIEEGDVLAEIETDKATMEFESFQEGVLLHIGIQEGDTAPVDSLLAILGEEGEDISSILSGGNEAKEEEVVDVVVEETTVVEDEPILDLNVEIVTMPRLSDTMTEGVVAQWHKKVGDKIEEGDVLAEIETDKATMEFESFQEGTLLYIGVNEGDSAPVDAILAILGEEGTDVTSIVNARKKSSSTSDKVVEVKKAEKVKAPAASKKQEEVKSVEVKQTKTADGRVLASPLAKKLATDKGIDISKVSGTGESGRVVKRDIDEYKEPVVSVVETSKAVSSLEESFEEVKVSQMRKTIARRLVESKNEAPHYYLTIEIDMDQAIANRKSINNMPDTKVSFNSLFGPE